MRPTLCSRPSAPGLRVPDWDLPGSRRVGCASEPVWGSCPGPPVHSSARAQGSQGRGLEVLGKDATISRSRFVSSRQRLHPTPTSSLISNFLRNVAFLSSRWSALHTPSQSAPAWVEDVFIARGQGKFVCSTRCPRPDTLVAPRLSLGTWKRSPRSWMFL